MKTNMLTSLESPVFTLVSKKEDATLKVEYAIAVLAIIKGVFDCAPFQKLFDAAREHDVDETLIKWIYAAAMQRLLCTELDVNRFLVTEATKGGSRCYHHFRGGSIQNVAIYVQAYAVQVAVLTVDLDPETMCFLRRTRSEEARFFSHSQSYRHNPARLKALLPVGNM